MQARKTHRKRVSALRLSSDTTTSLPAYIPSGGWIQPTTLDDSDSGTPLDLPPDYPDSAEEADEDTDDESVGVYVPQFSTSSSAVTTPLSPSRRPFRRPSAKHRRKQSLANNSSDIYLDSLLERSVHALEMSNALLQSSISTQTSLSTILGSESPSQRGYSQEDSTSALERSARGLSSRIRSSRDAHKTWVEDLEEIRQDVEALFTAEPERRSSNESSRSQSSSLPATTSPLHAYKQHQRNNSHRRRPSLDAISQQRLRYDLQDRDNLVARPPRALTQYVVANGDGVDGGNDTIILPSTLGLRSPGSAHHAAVPPSPSHSHLSPPIPSRSASSDAPRAYDFLSSLVSNSRNGSVSSSSTRTSSPIKNTLGGPGSGRGLKKRRQSTSSSSTGSTVTQAQNHRSRSQTPKPLASSSSSTGCPPIEEATSLPPSSPSSSDLSSSDSNPTKQTILSLRKILDEQPQPLAISVSDTEEYIIVRRPPPPPPAAIMRLSKRRAEVVGAGTSTATASVSRLFSKAGKGGVHSSSTRPPSPPRVSSIKGSREASASAGGSGVGTPVVTRTATPVDEYMGTGGPLRAASEGGASGSGSGLASPSTPTTPLNYTPLPSPSPASSATQALVETAVVLGPTQRRRKKSTVPTTAMTGGVSGKKAGLGLGLGLGLNLPEFGFAAFRRAGREGDAAGGVSPISPSASASGTSTPSRTPKRISFAELPESWVSERGEGGGSGSGSGFGFGFGGSESRRDKEGSGRRKDKGKGKGKGRGGKVRGRKGKGREGDGNEGDEEEREDGEEDGEGKGWWWWLVSPSSSLPASPGVGSGSGRWGGYGYGKGGYGSGGGGGPGLDDWTA